MIFSTLPTDSCFNNACTTTAEAHTILKEEKNAPRPSVDSEKLRTNYEHNFKNIEKTKPKQHKLEKIKRNRCLLKIFLKAF
ncbi:hypothetical protein CPC698_0003 [Chlamydia psittaci C6/98]|nr:hypothetical protein CPC698_0003 [Chlamydia psittaci C6/98]